VISVLLDQGLAPRSARLLAKYGIEATHVSEIGLAEADACSDSGSSTAIRPYMRHGRSRLPHPLALAGGGHPSVILLRVEGLGADEQAELIASICRQCECALVEGAAISADMKSVRVRRLPLA
jgi:predicted nuclease of predicted toxin-antitoxin system